MQRRQALGFLSAVALVVANMVGSGAFTTSGFLLDDLGSPRRVLLVWILGGIFAAMGALCYGALGRRFPESGGEYLFLSRSLHPAVGSMAGFVSLVVGFTAPVAAAAVAFGRYTQSWFAGLPSEWIATVLLILAGGLHGYRVRFGVRMQDGMVVLKLALIGVFVAWGVLRADPVTAQPSEASPSWSSWGSALVFVSFSYSGWNAAVYVASEMRQARQRLALALLTGTALVTVLYLGLNAVFVGKVPAEALRGQVEVARIAAEHLGGATWREVVTVLIALALWTSVSGHVMAGPRVYAKMASDRLLPSKLQFEDGAPRAAILLQVTLAIVLVWIAAFDSLMIYIGFTLSLSTAAAVIGLWRVRIQEGAAAVPIPGYPWIPGLFLLGVSSMAVASIVARPVESLWGGLTLLIGLAVWWFSPARTLPSRPARP